jgi:hypothetical protein
MPDLLSFLADPSWWAQQVVAWGVFTALVAGLVIVFERRREQQRREPWMRWHLVVWGDDPPDAQDSQLQVLNWDEVLRMSQSDHERWKTVKSVLSGYCQIRLARIERAESRDDPAPAWCRLDPVQRRLTIDLNRIPEDQRSAFHSGIPRCESPPWGPHAAGAPRARPAAAELRNDVR